MRVAIVETARLGGLLHYAVQLGDALARRGHEVDLVTARKNELVGRSGAARMRAVFPPLIKSTELPHSKIAYLFRRAGVASRLIRAWPRIIWETRIRRRYDAVIVNCDITLMPSTLGTALITFGPGRPAVANVCHNVRPFNPRGGDDLHAEWNGTFKVLRSLYPRFDVVFVHGERAREEFEAVWPPAHLAVIPHGDERIFAEEPPPPSPEEHILFFGDLRKNKGLMVLMEAFDIVAERRPGARLTIAGTPAPADFDPVPMLEWAKGHGDRVQVIDRYVPVEEVPALFARARVVATPYLAGYQSGVLHLAMTMGRAVVTSDVGDLGAAIGFGEAGLVVRSGDVQELADALERVIGDAELAAKLGEGGRRRTTGASSWEAVAEKAEAALLGTPRLAGAEGR